MRQSKSPNWEEIKAAYVFGGATLSDIVRRYHLTESALRKQIERGKWRELRAEETAARSAQATSIAATAEAARYARIISVSEKLVDKLEIACAELGEYYTVRRKTKSVVGEDGEAGNTITEEVVTEAIRQKSTIRAADVKAIASALRDLREVIRVGKEDAQASGEGFTVSFEGENAEGASE